MNDEFKKMNVGEFSPVKHEKIEQQEQKEKLARCKSFSYQVSKQRHMLQKKKQKIYDNFSKRAENFKANENKTFTTKVITKTAICAALLLIIGGVAIVDQPVVNQVKSGIKTALTFNLDIDQSLGKLKFVDKNSTDVMDVMNTSVKPVLSQPVSDKVSVTKNFLETNTGITYQATSICDITTPGDGVIENIVKEKEFQITIDHGNNIKSVLKYKGAMAVLTEGKQVKKGDYLGLFDVGNQLEFCVLDNGKNVDPVAFLAK